MSYEENARKKGPLLPHQLDSQESETAVFRSIDERSDDRMRNQSSSATGTDYQRVFNALDDDDGEQQDKKKHSNPKAKFKGAAQRVVTLQRLKLIRKPSRESRTSGNHNRNKSLAAADLLGTIGDNDDEDEEDEEIFQDVLVPNNPMDEVQKLYAPVEGEEEMDEEIQDLQEANQESDGTGNGEGLPLLPSSQYGSMDSLGSAGADMGTSPMTAHGGIGKKLLGRVLCFCRPACCFMRCSPECISWFFFRIVIKSPLFMLGVPCFVASWFLFYVFGNPSVDFLPGDITLAWWLTFVGRQTVTLALARLTQFILIDCIVLGSRVGIRLVGPFLSLFFIQGKGWPFIIAMWSIWNLFLLHGDDEFDNHWLYWTDISVFKFANSGSFILNSHQYLRVLLAMLLAGIATACKRLAMTVKFGRRQFSEFKPRLEKLLQEVVMLSEIASLAAQADDLESVHSEIEAVASKATANARRGTLADVTFSSKPIVEDEEESDSDSETEFLQDFGKKERRQEFQLSQMSSGSFKLTNFLDRWEEPVNKADKSVDVSINDVLKFKRALSYMDDHFPFGEDYGSARTRSESVASSDLAFGRLLKLARSKDTLPFSVLETLTIDEDGQCDFRKRKTLRKLFRPDRWNQLNQIAFLQTCDSVYKRLRYFRASVGNASVMDQVLESIIDGVFFFVLTLLLLSLLQYNPWTLLVSLTSLLVSVSFALGPSVAKYVEGILLIAVRRPFDLGDRIFFAGPDTVVTMEIAAHTYFVEDITIAVTTLRHASTNEVSTVNNWSISGSRIVNCNRSPNAMVSFNMTFHIGLLKDDKFEKFRTAMDTYVKNRPRLWDSVASCRHDAIDPDNELINVTLAVVHRQSWQDAARIKLNRADFVKYIYEIGQELGVNVDTPPKRRVIYDGGVLDQGGVHDYKRNLTKPSNIHTKYSSREALKAAEQSDAEPGKPSPT